MIESLKKSELVERIGGEFRLTALIQRRLKELVEGSRPLVNAQGKTLVEIAVQEIDEGKVVIDMEKTSGLFPEHTGNKADRKAAAKKE